MIRGTFQVLAFLCLMFSSVSGLGHPGFDEHLLRHPISVQLYLPDSLPVFGKIQIFQERRGRGSYAQIVDFLLPTYRIIVAPPHGEGEILELGVTQAFALNLARALKRAYLPFEEHITDAGVFVHTKIETIVVGAGKEARAFDVLGLSAVEEWYWDRKKLVEVDLLAEPKSLDCPLALGRQSGKAGGWMSAWELMARGRR